MIKHTTKSDLVFDELRDMIYSGELKPGEKISAIEIANRLGVSRTPVNEAVKRLADRKLVSILPNVGFRIITPSWEDVLDLQYLKMILERTAIEWIRDRDIRIDIDYLKSLNDKILNAINSKNWVRYNESVRKYHLEFIESVGSKPLLESFTGAWEYSGWEDTRLLDLSRDLVSQCKDHVEQLNYLAEREFENALELAAAHGEQWIKVFREKFEPNEINDKSKQ